MTTYKKPEHEAEYKQLKNMETSALRAHVQRSHRVSDLRGVSKSQLARIAMLAKYGHKKLSEAIMMTLSGIKGEPGHRYDKWGRRGGVEAWKTHVRSLHKGVTFSDHDGERAKNTHAHVGDKEVGSYSHYNHSSETLREAVLGGSEETVESINTHHPLKTAFYLYNKKIGDRVSSTDHPTFAAAHASKKHVDTAYRPSTVVVHHDGKHHHVLNSKGEKIGQKLNYVFKEAEESEGMKFFKSLREANSPHTAKIKMRYYAGKAREIKRDIETVDGGKAKSAVEHGLKQSIVGRLGGDHRKKVEHKLRRLQQAAAAAKSVRERHPSRLPANESRDDSIKHMAAALFGAVKVNRNGKKVVDVDKQRKADLGPRDPNRAEKIGSAMQRAYDATYGKKNESVEQIDEISMKAAGRYYKAAVADRADSFNKAMSYDDERIGNSRTEMGWEVGRGEKDAMDLNWKKRSIGMHMAKKRILKNPKNQSFIDRVHAAYESAEQIDELSGGLLKRYQKRAATAAQRSWDKASREEDRAMSTDGEKYPDKQRRHEIAAGAAVTTWRKRDRGHNAARLKLVKSPLVRVHASEETEINEISGRLASRYRNAAHASARSAVDKIAAWHTNDKDRKEATKTLAKRSRGLSAVARSERRTQKRDDAKWRAENKARRDEYFAKHGKQDGYHADGAWVARVSSSDPKKDEKIAALKKEHGSLRVRGRLGKNNPNAHLYRQGGPLHRSSSQDIKPEHAAHLDVYKRSRRVNEQINELSKDTLDSYVTKASKEIFRSFNKKKREGERAMSINGLENPGVVGKHQKAERLAHRVWAKRTKGVKLAIKKLTREDVEQIEESKDLRKHLQQNYVGADETDRGWYDHNKKDGTHTIRRGFYYKHGRSSEDHAKSVSDELTKLGVKHKIVDHGTVDKPFRGGASLKRQSHWWAKFTTESALDEAHSKNQLKQAIEYHSNRGGSTYVGGAGTDPRHLRKLNRRVKLHRRAADVARKMLAKENVEQIDEIGYISPLRPYKKTDLKHSGFTVWNGKLAHSSSNPNMRMNRRVGVDRDVNVNMSDDEIKREMDYHDHKVNKYLRRIKGDKSEAARRMIGAKSGPGKLPENTQIDERHRTPEELKRLSDTHDKTGVAHSMASLAHLKMSSRALELGRQKDESHHLAMHDRHERAAQRHQRVADLARQLYYRTHKPETAPETPLRTES